jgi:hypothetical protein
VVDRGERLAERPRERPGERDPHEERADQAGSRGDGDSVDLLERRSRIVERRLQDRLDVLQMVARRELGNDAAVRAVERDLGGDDVREDARSVLHDSDGRVVAGCLDAEDLHFVNSTQTRLSNPTDADRFQENNASVPSPSGRA